MWHLSPSKCTRYVTIQHEKWTYKNSLDDFLELIVQDEHEGATHASEHVGPGSLEEGLGALVTRDLPPAIKGAAVHDVS